MKTLGVFLLCACLATILASCAGESGSAPPPLPSFPTTQPTFVSPTAVASLPPAPKGASGIEGRSLIGPTCPVLRLDNPCPDRPYQAALVVLSANRVEVKRFETNAEGLFRIELPPGTYILVPQLSGKFPRAGEQTVTVTSGQFTAITVTFDSGMR